MTSKRGLQAILVLIGSVAVVAGIFSVLAGADLVPGVDSAAPNIDSELRFFAVWYTAAGLIVLRSVPRVETAAHIVRAVGAAFGVAGLARLLSLIVVGKPDTLFIVLMVLELTIPALIVPWQAKVASSDRIGKPRRSQEQS